MASSAPRFLGKQTRGPTKELDTFEWNPDAKPVGGPPEVSFETDEFTHLCPVTQQPDFGRLIIVYQPKEKLVETKSLKLYLYSFRDTLSFDEMLVATIAQDFYDQVEPEWVEVIGEFKSRGGIALTASKVIGK